MQQKFRILMTIETEDDTKPFTDASMRTAVKRHLRSHPEFKNADIADCDEVAQPKNFPEAHLTQAKEVIKQALRGAGKIHLTAIQQRLGLPVALINEAIKVLLKEGTIEKTEAGIFSLSSVAPKFIPSGNIPDLEGNGVDGRGNTHETKITYAWNEKDESFLLLARKHNVAGDGPGVFSRRLTEAEEESEYQYIPWDVLTSNQKREITLAWDKALDCIKARWRRLSDGCWTCMMECPGCSQAGGADCPVFHAPPLCKSPVKSKFPMSVIDAARGKIRVLLERKGGAETGAAIRMKVKLPNVFVDEALRLMVLSDSLIHDSGLDTYKLSSQGQ